MLAILSDTYSFAMGIKEWLRGWYGNQSAHDHKETCSAWKLTERCTAGRPHPLVTIQFNMGDRAPPFKLGHPILL